MLSRKFYLVISTIAGLTLFSSASVCTDVEGYYSSTKVLNAKVQAITNQLTHKHAVPNVASRAVYIPQQGMIIVIDEVDLGDAKLDQGIAQEALQQQTPEQQNLPQNSNSSVAQKQNLSKLRESAKNISHTLHHIEQQTRRLSNLRKSANEAERKEIDKQMSMLRDKASEFERKRRMTKSQIDQVKHRQTEKVDLQVKHNIKQSQRQQFYAQLKQSISLAICSDKKVFNELSANESISIVFTAGGKFFEGRNLELVMKLQIDKLERCEFESFEY